jgi:hypothetical protein
MYTGRSLASKRKNSMAKLILVEGIPGSGKSTTARNIEALLKFRGVQVHCFNEGDLHPCDLAWHSCVPIAEYEKLLQTFPEYQESLRHYTSVEDTYAYVTYGKLGLLPDHPLFIKLKSLEPYNGQVSLEEFKKLHFSRWKKFGEQTHEDVTYIFECAYLQNHIVELILTYQQDYDYIKMYTKELIETVLPLRPFLIYLSPTNVEWTINNAASERKTDRPDIWNDWIDDVIAYMENSNYGKANNATGLAASMRFFKERQRLELDLIKELPIQSYVHEVQIGFTQPRLEDNQKLVAMLTSSNN